MIKVRIYSVSTCSGDINVNHDYKTFSSYKEMFDTIIEENGEEDVNGDLIMDQYGEYEIIFEGDVWFEKWEIVDDNY